MGQRRLNISLLLILYLFYADRMVPFPGNGLGWKGSLKIIQLHACPEAPAAPFKPRHCVTVGLLIFWRDVEGVMVLECCWNPVASPFLAL